MNLLALAALTTALVATAPAGAADSPTADANLAIGKRFATEALGRADMKAFDDLVDPDVVVVTGLSPAGPIRGRDNYKKVFQDFAQSWPVREFVLHEAFAVGDRVVVRFTATGVFTKDYFGVKANRVVAPMEEIQVYTVRKGRIVQNVVAAVNYPFEFTMYPALKDAVLGNLQTAPKGVKP